MGGGLCLDVRLESQGAASLLLPFLLCLQGLQGPTAGGRKDRISAFWWHWTTPPHGLCSPSSLFAPEDPPVTPGSFSGVYPSVEGTG